MRLRQLVLTGIIVTGLTVVGARAAQESPGARLGSSPTTRPLELPGSTIPSAQHQLNVRASEVIKKVEVQPGQEVEVKQLLIQLDDTEEKARLAVAEGEVEAMKVAIEAAKQDLAFKTVERQRYENMGEAAKWIEKERAKVEEKQAELAIAKAQADLKTKELQVQYQKVVIDRMKITSPIKGVVQEVNLREGELPDPNKPPIVIVQNNPLWVKVNVPAAVSQALRERIRLNEQRTRDKLPLLPLPRIRVKYLDRDEYIPAKPIYFSPVADAGAGTQVVRLEIPNDNNARDAGLQVRVYIDPMPPVGNDKAAAGVARTSD
jgi:multidrug efflux pump subunit AcrA (membrane-fusion protein)